MSSKPKPQHLVDASTSENDAAWLLDGIWERMNERNEHFVGVFVGREGSGKSLTAIKTAEVLDPDFDAEENVFFKLDNFLEVLAEGTYEAGDVYVLDEAGVQLGNRTWQDRAQVLANQALQLIRDHNVGLIFTLPRLSELDKQARGRVQLMFEIVAKNPDQYVKIRPKLIEPDRTGTTGKNYQKYPRREAQQQGISGVRKVKTIRMTPPTEQVLSGYQAMKNDFQNERYSEAIAKLRGEDADEDGTDDPQEIADSILDEERVQEFVREYNDGTQVVIDWKTIANEYSLGEGRAKRVKRALIDEVEFDAM